jgi:hypothetical protein
LSNLTVITKSVFPTQLLSSKCLERLRIGRDLRTAQQTVQGMVKMVPSHVPLGPLGPLEHNPATWLH